MRVKPLLTTLNPKTFLSDLLTAYGIEDEFSYLNPSSDLFDDPFDYPDMDKAVNLLMNTIENNQPIGTLIDEDADGAMSSGIIVDFLKNLGIEPIIFFHTEKAHGLSDDVFDTIKQAELGLLILPDSGTNDFARCAELHKSGCEVLILDHHNIEHNNPDAVVINPHLSPDTLNCAISGTGVTYHFIEACCERYGLEYPNYMDMVAFSIISDVCDLTSYENRAFVEFGLNVDDSEDANSKYFTNPLLKLMFTKLAKGSTTPKDVAWSVAPKINALFRVGDNEAKQTFFSALIGEGSIEDGLAVANKAHRTQTKIVKELVEAIEHELDHTHNVLVAYIDVEYRNYSGLIANKLLGAYHKPALILREYHNPKFYSGSMRSPIPLAPYINATGLADCRGHDEASGIFLKKDNINKLIEWFDNTSLESDPEIPVTAIVTSNKLSPSICKVCTDNSMLWGKNVSAPTFYMKGTIDTKNVNFYRKQNTTIKFNMNGMDFLKFRANEDDIKAFEKDGLWDVEVIFTPSLNEWNGNVTVQGFVKKYEIKKHENVEQEDWEDLF